MEYKRTPLDILVVHPPPVEACAAFCVYRQFLVRSPQYHAGAPKMRHRTFPFFFSTYRRNFKRNRCRLQIFARRRLNPIFRWRHPIRIALPARLESCPPLTVDRKGNSSHFLHVDIGQSNYPNSGIRQNNFRRFYGYHLLRAALLLKSDKFSVGSAADRIDPPAVSRAHIHILRRA